MFIDFLEAFDCVQHTTLMYAFVDNNISSNMFKVIKSMYAQMKYETMCKTCRWLVRIVYL
jgi:hypothetical protein